jgi:lysozyme family protein
MTAANFSRCLTLVLASEGGNDDDPDDPGGRTSRGITQREYDAYRKTRRNLPSDVWKASQSAIEVSSASRKSEGVPRPWKYMTPRLYCA